MLELLKIKNVAIIDQTEISFKEGLNILSGETGAGKSIVLEAISLLLGSRASSELIRTGEDEAVVEGLFDISELDWMKSRLTDLGFSSSGSDLLIKRSIQRSGKHRIHVNGELATLSILQQLCQGLIDLCGQHEHQSLTRPQVQLDLLDRYGNLSAQAKEITAQLTELKSWIKTRDELKIAEADRLRRADFLTFQIEELRAASLVEGEEESLATEKQLLQSSEQRLQSADQARECLEAEDSGALNLLRTSLTKLRALHSIDESITPIQEGIERALVEAEEGALSLNRYIGSVELNPSRLVEVQERLALLADLRRKYGANIGEMLETLSRLEEEQSSLGKTGEKIEELEGQIEKRRSELLKAAKKLSTARKKFATLLSDSVTGEIKDLKMGDARFAVELEFNEDLDQWGAGGGDQIQFIVQTNRGEEARPLGKIASGGELSRLMLGIRRVIADRGGIGVYLFDEIDAGIGGQTAFQVGKKLKSVAAYNQVICITHLPQVAAFASNHLVVRKTVHGKRTLTEVASLSTTERKEELARMLGGAELTKKSLENAAELLQLAR